MNNEVQSYDNLPLQMRLNLLSASLQVQNLHYHRLPCTCTAYMSCIHNDVPQALLDKFDDSGTAQSPADCWMRHTQVEHLRQAQYKKNAKRKHDTHGEAEKAGSGLKQTGTGCPGSVQNCSMVWS